MFMKILILSVMLLGSTVWAQTPLPVDEHTVALWNFNTDVGDNVPDSGPHGLTGTAYSSTLAPIPGISSAFQNARTFNLASSFVDFGNVQGSVLDFANKNEFSIEAVIHLTASASGTSMIANFENVRFMVVNNQLAGAIRQPNGLIGLTSPTQLQVDQTYRVGLHFKKPYLVLSINNRINAQVLLDYPIQAPTLGTSRASIGGDIFGRVLPGLIDDVRVSDSVRADITAPEVTLVEPGTFQVGVPRPHFVWNLGDDNSGVDINNIFVYLNGVQQTGLTISPTQITGQLSDPMRAGDLNNVKIVVYDQAGNYTEKNYYFALISIVERGEYAVDPSTLLLWHMNDLSPGFLTDETPNQRHAQADPSSLLVTEGVFGQARTFDRLKNSIFYFDSIRFPDKTFTIEGWYRPTSGMIADASLFYNGQIQLVRTLAGRIRVDFYTAQGTVFYTSNDVLLPTGELHHIAVSWDGTKNAENLVIYQDGIIRAKLNAVYDCEFDNLPKTSSMGNSFNGMIDEVRFSSAVRTAFNIPTVDTRAIDIVSPRKASSVDHAFPVTTITLQSGAEILLSSIKVKLNGQEELASANLSITQSEIRGTFSRPLNLGVNEIEVSFRDASGTQKNKREYFFYVQKLGGGRSTDADTVGHWHFEDGIKSYLSDSLGRGQNMAARGGFTAPVLVNGVVGTGLGNTAAVSNMTMNCQPFTVEGYFKVEGTTSALIQVAHLSTSRFYHTLSINPVNGAVEFKLSGPGIPTSMNSIVEPGLFPTDQLYHHVALVHDNSRGYAQLVYLVDGEVKRTIDVRHSCLVSGAVTLALGASSGTSTDEVKVSKVAKYAFEVVRAGEDRPSLVSSTPAAGNTVSGNSTSFNFTIQDNEGVDITRTKVYLNGQNTPISSFGKAIQLTTSFEGTLNLIPGTNFVDIEMYDLKGNSQFKTIKLYRFDKATGPYSSDLGTHALFHFEEPTGNFLDSSDNAFSISRGNFSSGVNGVFGRSADTTSGTSISVPLTGLSGAKTWTVETWAKGTFSSGSVSFMNIPSTSFNFYAQSSQLSVSLPAGGGTISSAGIVPTDGQYHHFALVGDETHPYEQLYFLIDGKVVKSSRVEAVSLNVFPSSGAATMASGLVGSLDEWRLSKVPRYQLNSTKP